MVSRIGKTQIENAMMVFGNTPYLNQTMMSGPSATFGIMLRLTRSGIIAFSHTRDQENDSAIATPITTARM